MENKDTTRINAFQLWKLQVLRGLNGHILKDSVSVRNTLRNGFFTTLKVEPNKYAPNGSYYVELWEVEAWNAKIMAELKERKEIIDALHKRLATI
jgi:hypothetical protein